MLKNQGIMKKQVIIEEKNLQVKVLGTKIEC